MYIITKLVLILRVRWQCHIYMYIYCNMLAVSGTPGHIQRWRLDRKGVFPAFPTTCISCVYHIFIYTCKPGQIKTGVVVNLPFSVTHCETHSVSNSLGASKPGLPSANLINLNIPKGSISFYTGGEDHAYYINNIMTLNYIASLNYNKNGYIC